MSLMDIIRLGKKLYHKMLLQPKMVSSNPFASEIQEMLFRCFVLLTGDRRCMGLLRADDLDKVDGLPEVYFSS